MAPKKRATSGKRTTSSQRVASKGVASKGAAKKVVPESSSSDEEVAPTQQSTEQPQAQSSAAVPDTDQESVKSTVAVEMSTLSTKQAARIKRKACVIDDEVEVDLAEWLRNNPELYNKGMKLFKDRARKDRLWAEKAAEIKVDLPGLKTWYESIRTKVGKMFKTKSGQPTRDLTERDAFIKQNFSFLSQHISRMKGRVGCSVSY